VKAATAMCKQQTVRILYVGRKPQLANALQTIFAEQNQANGSTSPSHAPTFDFFSVTSQKLALADIRLQPPGAVCVEIEKKAASRLRFCEMVRYRLPTAVILAVAASKPENTFPFDGLIKVPLSAQQVLAALSQINHDASPHFLQRGPLALNIAARTVTSPKGEFSMTPKQCALLQMLMNQPNQVISRSDMMQEIWETSYLEDTRTLDVHIRWLRECIEPDPSNPIYLKTVRGLGYRLSIGS
jgi:DNA-binding response OmpR family regulator